MTKNVNKDFLLPQDTLFSPNKPYYWIGSEEEAEQLINWLPYQKTSIYDDYEFEFLKEKETDTSNWSMQIFVNSVLYFYIEQNFSDYKKAGMQLLTDHEWFIFLEIALNPKISKDTLVFLRHLGLVRISSEDAIFNGAIKLFKHNKKSWFSISDFSPEEDKIALENVLFFLGFSKERIDFLIKNSFEKQDLTPIIDCLLKKENKVNEIFVLENNLNNFKDLKVDEDVFQNILDDFVDQERGKLEEFNSFNIFESDEEAKSQSNTLFLLTEYDYIFQKIKKDNNKNLFKLFLLFENYVFFDADSKSYLFISDLSGFEIKKHLFDFSKNQKILKKAEKEGYFKEDLFPQKKDFMSPFFDSLILIFKLLPVLFFILSIKSDLISSRKYVFNKKSFETPTAIEITDRFFLEKENQVLERNLETNTRSEQNQKTTKFASISSSLRTRFHVRNKTQENQGVSKQLKVEQLNKKLKESGLPGNTILNLSEDGQINCLNSVWKYGDTRTNRNAVKKFLQENNCIYNLNNEADHTCQQTLLKTADVSPNQVFTVERSKDLHKEITKKHEIIWTTDFGYTPNKGTYFDWVNQTGRDKLKVIEGIFEENPAILLKDGLTLKDTLNATSFSLEKDQEFLKNLTTNPELLFVMVDFKIITGKCAEQFYSSVEKLRCPNGPLDIKRVNKSITEISQYTQELDNFFFSCQRHLGKHPRELEKVRQRFKYYQDSKNHFCSVALDVGADLVVTEKLNSEEKSSEFLSLEELETKSKHVFKMKKRTRGVKFPWSSPRDFSRRSR